MIELGGVGTFWGPVLGAAVIVFGNEFLRLAGTLRLTLLGALICTIILFYPGGVIQFFHTLEHRIEGWIKQKAESN
jgi:branched-chain amino acid transport system permease protein